MYLLVVPTEAILSLRVHDWLGCLVQTFPKSARRATILAAAQVEGKKRQKLDYEAQLQKKMAAIEQLKVSIELERGKYSTRRSAASLFALQKP